MILDEWQWQTEALEVQELIGWLQKLVSTITAVEAIEEVKREEGNNFGRGLAGQG